MIENDYITFLTCLSALCDYKKYDKLKQGFVFVTQRTLTLK